MATRPVADNEKPRAAGKPECPVCFDTGWAVRKDGTLGPCECEQLGEIRRRERLAEACIPPRFAGKTLDTFRASDPVRRKIVNAAKSCVKGFSARRDYSRGLLIRGAPGAGKTHLAVGILLGIIGGGFTGRYVNSPDLMKRLMASANRESDESELDIVEECARPDLLLLDDLGAESTNRWATERLYLVLNRRYEQLLPIIVTTSADDDALREKLGEQMLSRFHEMCAPLKPDLPDEDYRLKMMQ